MEQDVDDVKLKLISSRQTEGRIYNKPTVSEVAALILGDVDKAEKRDIILYKPGMVSFKELMSFIQHT
jgi:hypothetical protein